MNNCYKFLIAILAIATTLCVLKKDVEEFTAPGLVFNIPSQWWHPQKYNNVDWLVTEYLDRLSQPSCLSYNRGNPAPLNFNASTYRFWRF